MRGACPGASSDPCSTLRVDGSAHSAGPCGGSCTPAHPEALSLFPPPAAARTHVTSELNPAPSTNPRGAHPAEPSARTHDQAARSGRVATPAPTPLDVGLHGPANELGERDPALLGWCRYGCRRLLGHRAKFWFVLVRFSVPDYAPWCTSMRPIRRLETSAGPCSLLLGSRPQVRILAGTPLWGRWLRSLETPRARSRAPICARPLGV
jgi:hypothetical protein